MGALPKLAVRWCWVRKKLLPGSCRWVFMLYPTKDTFLAAQGRREAQGVFCPLTPKLLWEEEMMPQAFH